MTNKKNVLTTQSSPLSQSKQNILQSLTNNNNIKRHALKSQFTSNLTGRFYTNNSFEAHQLKQSTLKKLNDRQQSMIQAIQKKEERCTYLQKKFKARFKERVDLIEDMKQRFEMFIRGVIKLQSIVKANISYQRYQTIRKRIIVLQSFIRTKLAFSKFRSLKEKKLRLIILLQSWYRGSKDREIVLIHRQNLKIKQQQHMACILIQSAFRRCMCKQKVRHTIINQIMIRRKEEKQENEKKQRIIAARIIIKRFLQSTIIRIRWNKHASFIFEKRISASIKIQSCIRGLLCRKHVRWLRLRLQLLINHKKTTKSISFYSNQSSATKPVFVVGVPNKRPIPPTFSLIHKTLHHYRKKCIRSIMSTATPDTAISSLTCSTTMTQESKTSNKKIRKQSTTVTTNNNTSFLRKRLSEKAIQTIETRRRSYNSNTGRSSTRTDDINSSSTSINIGVISNNKEENGIDPHEAARLRAAARAAKVGKNYRKEKEKELQIAKAVAKRVAQLECKRFHHLREQQQQKQLMQKNQLLDNGHQPQL